MELHVIDGLRFRDAKRDEQNLQNIDLLYVGRLYLEAGINTQYPYRHSKLGTRFDVSICHFHTQTLGRAKADTGISCT